MNAFSKIVLILTAVFLQSCATMIRGTSQDISMNSDPSGAVVEFIGESCQTPCILNVARSTRPAMITFKLDGRESYLGEIVPNEMLISENPGSSLATGLGALLIVPGIVDLVSGTLHDWPHTINVMLPEKGKGGAMLKADRVAK